MGKDLIMITLEGRRKGRYDSLNGGDEGKRLARGMVFGVISLYGAMRGAEEGRGKAEEQQRRTTRTHGRRGACGACGHEERQEKRG